MKSKGEIPREKTEREKKGLVNLLHRTLMAAQYTRQFCLCVCAIVHIPPPCFFVEQEEQVKTPHAKNSINPPLRIEYNESYTSFERMYVKKIIFCGCRKMVYLIIEDIIPNSRAKQVIIKSILLHLSRVPPHPFFPFFLCLSNGFRCFNACVRYA